MMLKQTAKKTFLGLRSSTAGRRFYHENVIDHFENPRNVGSFKRDDPDVGTGLVGSPACGDLMTLQIKVDESGHITDSRFKTFGCGAAIAASSVASEWIKGKTVSEVMTIKNAMLAEDAIKSAVQNYKEKKAIADASVA
ncbi:Iron-sulfur cluster assembly protein 2 [Raphanus sativus]|uniref:Iron-sulfur cluster assembly protein 2-like isoform X2 n=1 Tax=Raphanus sativus TaxID=3726 RepID=A0A9W3CNN9_RAPSA|nr:iron-sulfur cluster assembly protein 2-like isoform X2 [Raphanus sativus]KAJ4872086.1 Iron-sulfur cluster assembly protein 2 [Raphanus sativus]